MSISWIKVNGSRQEKLNLGDVKYKGSDESQLFINDVRKEDEAGYEAVISRDDEKVKIHSNKIVLRGFGGILLQIMKIVSVISCFLSDFLDMINRYHALMLFF